ncbi:MAG TPA: BTAD domain-containing putative transcriptional regulator [Acidimicrobiia bacterium]|nr:BTAD domain-containing putative transcriptional regulator [Acidimicrobiia bacterium]
MVDIRLLGRFSARRDGEEIPPGAFGGRLVRTLVRILLTRRGTFISRDVLAEALWPERMPADPAANLRVLVQRARTALGDPALILTGPGGYSFAAEADCRVDAETFLAAVEAGRRHLAAGQAGLALRELRAALDVWGGEPLAEDAYEDWAQELRSALFRAYLEALEDGTAAALALRDPAQAVALAELAVAREPLREPAALLLARALAEAGDTVAALRALDALRRRLSEEVGLEPSHEARELETRLQRGEPLAAPIRRPVLGLVRPGFEGLSFVGREDELDGLLAATGGSTPGVALVGGSAGAGKSRLLAEAAARSAVPVVVARAFLPERDEPWSLARTLLRELLALDLEAVRAIPDRAALALADILPELDELRPLGQVSVDPESRRALALEGVARLAAAAASKGALLLVDDLQWADATSLTALRLIARRATAASLVFAFRPEEVVPGEAVAVFLSELPALRQPVVEIPVEPLAIETIGLLVAEAELAGVLAEETDRTPLAVAETIRSLSSQGVVELDAGGRWVPRGDDSLDRAREVARSGQRRTIQARAGAQPPDQRRLLGLLALLGREVPARVLARAAGVEQAKVLDDLDALIRGGLARLGDKGWATAHDMISEAVAEGLERAERGRLHQLLADALREETGDPAELARHLAGAGDPGAAAASFAAAAGERLARYAGAEACELADAGLALEPTPAQRTALLRTRAEARDVRGDLVGARDDLREALVGIPPGPERARGLVRLAELTRSLEGYVEAGDLIEVALAEAGSDLAARAEALVAASFFDANRNDPERAEARATEALSLFERIGNPAGVATVLDARSMVMGFQGRLRDMIPVVDRVARLYRDSGRLLKVGTIRVWHGWLLAMQDRAQEGLQVIDEALELERLLGQTEGEAIALWGRSEVLSILGRAEEARTDAEAAMRLSRGSNNREDSALALRALAYAHAVAGDLDRAEAALCEVLDSAGDIPYLSSTCRALLGSVLSARGDLDGAEEQAIKAVQENVLWGGYEGRLVLAEVALARSDPDAERLAADALAQSDAGGYLTSLSRKRIQARYPAIQPLAAAPLAEARRARRAFMFTDIVSSTNLVEVLGDEAWDHLLRWHDQTLRALFAGHGGEEVNRIGDGFFVAFDRPEPAVRCAVDIQWALERHRVEHGFAPRVRIGVHEAEATQEGSDYQGRGVHEAARIAGAAGADEILVSAPIAALLDGAAVSTPRRLSLKGFREPVEVVAVDWH